MTRAGIAVILPCFNLGRTLEEALESVARQTRLPAECVVVDDGSTDVYTRQVLARLESTGHRILRTSNRGPAAARNAGIALTSSPYVVLLDADDCLDPTYLERAAARLDDEPGLAFVSCGMRSFGDANEVWTPPAPDLVRSLSGEVVHISSMFRREVWDIVGGFDENLRGHEDVDFWVSALERGFVGAVIPDPLLSYRARSGSVYQRAIVQDTHLGLMSRIYDKHRSSLESHAEALILQKERFILTQEAHGAHLRGLVQRMEAECAAVDAEIEAIRTELKGSGIEEIEFADLRRTTPISDTWGTDRGLPLDRYYIQAFLERHRQDVRGHVLEVKDSGYADVYGSGQVTRVDVLDVDPTNEKATIVADLAAADSIADDSFDCFILTQTLGLIYDPASAVAEAFRILKPGGVLLCTVPAAGRISYEDRHLDGDFWRFTEASVRRIFANAFPVESFEVSGHGNVLACTAFLYGLAGHEITREELDVPDPFFPLVYAIRAVKPAAAERPDGDDRPRSEPLAVGRAGASSLSASARGRAAILLYHRIADDDGAAPAICLPTAVFHAHLRHLRDDGYSVVPLSEVRQRIAEGTSPDGCVALTFDDGYAEMLTTVAPILARHGYPSTHFIVGQSLTRPLEFWWDTLRRVFLSIPRLPPKLTIDLADLRLEFPTETEVERQTARARLTEGMYRLSRADREKTITRLLDWSGAGPVPSGAPRPLSADELRELSRYDGIEIGAHTEDHVWLPAETPQDQRHQIVETKRRLEALIEHGVTSFAYPYGVWSDAAMRMVADAGFREAVTTEEQAVTGDAHALLLPRIDVGGCGVVDLAARLRRHLAGPT